VSSLTNIGPANIYQWQTEQSGGRANNQTNKQQAGELANK